MQCARAGVPGRCLRHTLLNSTYPPRHAPSGPRCPGSEIDKSRPAEGLSARGSRSAREGDGLRGDGGYPPFFCGSLSLACNHSGRKRRAEGAFVVRGVGESGVYNTLPFFFSIFYLFYLTMTAIWMGLCLNRFFYHARLQMAGIYCKQPASFRDPKNPHSYSFTISATTGQKHACRIEKENENRKAAFLPIDTFIMTCRTEKRGG